LAGISAQTIRGPEVSQDSRIFDFNALVPMPISLDVVSGSGTDDGLALVAIHDNWISALVAFLKDCSRVEEIFQYASKESVERDYLAIRDLLTKQLTEDAQQLGALQSKLEKLYKEALETGPYNSAIPTFFYQAYYPMGVEKFNGDRIAKHIFDANVSPYTYNALEKFIETKDGAKMFALGRHLKENIRLYGFPTWYEWCCENWGTKWNACEVELDRENKTLSFDTAWAAPEGIITALANKYPDLEWEWTYADEDTGCNTGIYTHTAGVLAFTNVENLSNEAYELYISLWGKSMCLGQDEQGNWFHHECGETCPHYNEC